MQLRRGFVVGLALLMGIGCRHGGFRVPSSALVVRNATVIDGTGKPPIVNGAVVVEGRRILFVGTASGLAIPQGVQVLDAGGGTILPGIINSHTYSTHDPAVRRAFPADGVTTICNLGTTLARLPSFATASTPEGPAARGIFAGPIITAPGGYPGPVYGSGFCREVASADEARAAVADLLGRGAGVIKIALARVKAITAEAHAHGVLVRAHVFEPFLVEDIVLPTGVDVTEHLPFPILTREEEKRVLGSGQPAALLYDTVAPGFVKMLERMVRQGVVMVPTLDAVLGALFAAPQRTPVEQVVFDVKLEAVRRFHALGGILAVGNDFGGVERVAPGMPLVEMQMLRALGTRPSSAGSVTALVR